MNSVGFSDSETQNNPDIVGDGASLGLSDSETQFFSDEINTTVAETEPDLVSSEVEQVPQIVYVPETSDSLHQKLVDMIMQIYCPKYAEIPKSSLVIDDVEALNCCEATEDLKARFRSVPSSVTYTLMSKCGTVWSAHEHP